MFLTHVENQRPVVLEKSVRGFTAVEISSDQPFFICTRLQCVGENWMRTTALLMFEDDMREILKEKESKLVSVIMLEPDGSGWKSRNIMSFCEVFSKEHNQNILIFLDESDRLATLWPNTKIPEMKSLPAWSKPY